MAAVNRRLGWVTLIAALAALSVIWRLLPAAAPPLYDGICLADPYRLLGSSPAPTSASMAFPASSSSSHAVVETGETPAQAQLLMGDGTFVSPTAPFTVSIRPVTPAVAAPSGMAIDGNVYELSAVTATGQSLTPAPQTPMTIVLRGTATAGPTRTIERLDGHTWTALKTFQTGCGDTFEAVSTHLGDFAVFKTQSTAPQQPSGGFPVAIVVAACVVVVVISLLGLARFSRRRR